MDVKHIVAWDLGGTKCNAGIVQYDSSTQELTCVKQCKVMLRDTLSLQDLVSKVEALLDFSHAEADCVCIAGAGIFDGQNLLLEKAYPYPMNFGEVAKEFKWPTFDVIHDYAPIVCATFTSYMEQPGNVKYLNHIQMRMQGRRVALGLGTGLGLKDGILFPNGDFWLGQNEIGHTGITFPPAADPEKHKLHQAIMEYLFKNNPHQSPVTFENLLTGKGLLNLYRFYHPNTDISDPKDVGEKMHDTDAKEMVGTLSWYLGLFVGTVQLTFMPNAGIWITGGVVIKNLEIFDHVEFNDGIYASPAYWPQRREFPLGVLCNPEHALIGCGYYASRRLLNKTDNGQSKSLKIAN